MKLDFGLAVAAIRVAGHLRGFVVPLQTRKDDLLLGYLPQPVRNLVS